MFKKFQVIFVLLSALFFLGACQTTSSLTLKFNTNGGTPVSDMVIEGDDVIMMPNDPTKQGYLFAGWFIDSELSDEFSSSLINDIQDEDTITLYAKWNIITYSIDYVLDGGQNPAGQKASYTIEDQFDVLSPTKDGSTFLGWYLENTWVTPITSVALGTTGDLTFYAKWEDIIVEPTIYTITFKNDDGTILETDLISEGQLPTYDGDTPTKPDTLEYTYVFIGWTPEIGIATKDQEYIAIYQETLIEISGFDPKDLNDLFGFDIYSQIPVLETDDYLVLDYSDTTWFEVYVDLFDWTSDDADAYMDALDLMLSYDDFEESWILGSFYLYVYEDSESYTPDIVYGVGIYGDKEGTENNNPFDPTELNAIFGFDLYDMMPPFTSDESLILDYSSESFFEVYIDIFDWTEADSDAYMDDLDMLLTYDAVEESWVIGDYFLYVYADDQSYPGDIVYGIGIYGDRSGDENPVDGLYYQFDLQSTLTSLASSYRENIDVFLDFTGSGDKVLVKGSQIATITSSPPTGLSTGIIFAADVSTISNPLAYLEIDTLGKVIDSISFEIEARDSFSSRLLGAKLQVYDNGAWVDLAGGDFYSQLSSDKVLITIENVQSSHFRLLFTGSGNSSNNGGQFKIYQVNLYGSTAEVTYPTWNEMIVELEGLLEEPSLDTLIPEFDSASDLIIQNVGFREYAITGALDVADVEQTMNDYVQSLISKGFVYNAELTLQRGFDVYTYEVNEDLIYAVYFYHDQGLIQMRIWAFDPIIDTVDLLDLSERQSINAYEELKFGKSGLPSTGTYDVLVIPVEINGTPFPSNYLAKLDLVFNGTEETTGWESVSSFYQQSSFGKLDLNFVISTKFTTPNPRSYYESFGGDGDQYAIVEALNGLNGTIDYSQYDSNQDGLIDSVIFIYSVDYEYDVEPWWAWVYAAQYGEGSSISTLDGKGFEYYMWASYNFLTDLLPNASNLVVNAETYIHELGHLMGAVDLYSYTHDYGPTGGMGMMDINNGDHDPLHKMLFGWLQPMIAVEGSYQVELESYSLDQDGLNSAIVVPYRSTDFDDGNAFDEFLIIMFYTPEGLYDAYQGYDYVLDEAAVIVYHADARIFSNATFWEGYFMYNNDGPSDFILEVLEVDKNESLPSMGGPLGLTDVLRSGVFDMSSYTWKQGGTIDVSIQVLSAINNSSDSVSLLINVN